MTRSSLCDNLIEKLCEAMTDVVATLTEDEVDFVIKEQLLDCLESFSYIHEGDVENALDELMLGGVKKLKEDLISTHWFRLITRRF